MSNHEREYQHQPSDPLPQITDAWGQENRRHQNSHQRRRDYLSEDREYVDNDWTKTFYRGIFPALYVLMLFVCLGISWPVFKNAQETYVWYDHWAIVIANGFTIAVLACVHFYLIDRDR